MKQISTLLNKTLGKQYLNSGFLKNSFFARNKGLTKMFSTVFVNHRDLPGNDEQAPFDFTEENYVKVEEILVSYTTNNPFNLNTLYFSVI